VARFAKRHSRRGSATYFRQYSGPNYDLALTGGAIGQAMPASSSGPRRIQDLSQGQAPRNSSVGETKP